MRAFFLTVTVFVAFLKQDMSLLLQKKKLTDKNIMVRNDLNNVKIKHNI